MIRIISEHKADKSIDTIDIIDGLLVLNPSLKSLIRYYLGPEVTDNYIMLKPKDRPKLPEKDCDALNNFREEILISKEVLERLHSNFKSHYSVTNPLDAFNDVSIKWPSLSAHMQAALNPIKVAYKFIHRFNGAKWFLTAHRHELDVYGDIGCETALKEEQRENSDIFFDMCCTGERHPTTLDTMTMATATDGSCSYYDCSYLDNVKSNDNYANDKRVWSAILPAQELRLLIQHNLFNKGNEANFGINFKSITYETPRANVDYPHCIAVYATHNGTPALDDAAVVICADFRNKAGNFDSLCPPSCTKYFWPGNLPA